MITVMTSEGIEWREGGSQSGAISSSNVLSSERTSDEWMGALQWTWEIGLSIPAQVTSLPLR